MGISAATGEGVKDLMRRTRKLVDAVIAKEEEEGGTHDTSGIFDGTEKRIVLESEEEEESFGVLTDPNFPGQFRVVGTKIERVHWQLLKYYHTVVFHSQLTNSFSLLIMCTLYNYDII